MRLDNSIDLLRHNENVFLSFRDMYPSFPDKAAHL